MFGGEAEMSWLKKTFVGVAAVGLAAAVSGCNGGGAAEDASSESGVHAAFATGPEWVNKGGAAFPEDKGKAIFGVGSFSGSKNPALARSAVDSRARAAVAETLKTFVASVMKDYMKSVVAGDMDSSEEGMVVERVAKNITKTTLVGCEIVDRHYDEKFNMWHALAKLEMNNIAMGLRKEIQNTEEVRKLKVEAAKAHEELDKIIQDTATEMY